MKGKARFSLTNLMQNNKFLFVIAVLISLSVWIYMSMGGSIDTSLPINDIPVQIELSDEALNSGLQVFTAEKPTASVTVTGNRTILGTLTKNDITVTASATSINSAGDYSVPVSASKTNPSANFQIASTVVPASINVTVDYLRESSFQIQDTNVVYRVSDGYYGFTSLSATSLTVSGPQTEISKIDKVCAVAEIDGSLTSTVTTDAELVLYDEDNNVLPTDLITMDAESVRVTVTVQPEKTVKVEPVFINKPEGLDITDDLITIEPSEILLAGPQEVISETDSVSLEAIDFSTLTNSIKTYDALGIDIPADCRNLSNSTTAKVTIDLSGFKSKSFTVDRFTVEGLSDDYNAEVTQQNLSIVVYGPSSQLDSLEPEEITGVVNLSGSTGTTGSVQMPVSFKIDGADSCWVYDNYRANLTITEK